MATSNPIQNNTALLADSSNDIGTLFCVSGGLSSNTAKWLAPDGTDMMDNNGSFAIVRGEGSTQSYIALQLNTGYSLTDADEGVYTCIIPDENGIEQTLYVGLYRFGFYGRQSLLCYYCPILIQPQHLQYESHTFCTKMTEVRIIGLVATISW